MQRTLEVGLVCGGPSLERGISLNSARSIMDNLESGNIRILPFYLDQQRRAYKISKAQLYSNTPSDFDFKLVQLAKPLSRPSFIRALKKVGIVFPVIHGAFGEDGELQSVLEKHRIPFIGSGSIACKTIFDKFKAYEFMAGQNFKTMPTALFKIYHHDHEQIINDFFEKNKIKHAIVKPACGGSSIGVFPVHSKAEALERVKYLFSKRMDTRVVLEPFAEGTEFTVIVLENRFGLPVAILPTEMEADYGRYQIFDFRKKYLPTRHVIYRCPPRFENELIEKIQVGAEQIFAAAGMHDFARFDGWVLKDGTLWFADLNPISGMEQHSFLFQQASRVGLSHHGVLRYILESACRRQKVKLPANNELSNNNRKNIPILFGGKTSERQVSLLSGTNIWLKLLRSKEYRPIPYLLDMDNNVWKLPYALILNHTVEEIAENCKRFAENETRLSFLEKRASLRLNIDNKLEDASLFAPVKMSLEEFVKSHRFVFNALHGGDGEDGTIQTLFEKHKVRFNGPNSKVSKLCAEKWQTNQKILELGIAGIRIANNSLAKTRDLLALSSDEINRYWKKLVKELKADSIIIKPNSDGCSSGVVRLFEAHDLIKYIDLTKNDALSIPAHTFKNQTGIIEMPTSQPDELLFEEFIITDDVSIIKNELKHHRQKGWIEVTVGVIEYDGVIQVLNPSLTVARGEVLSVEEKFQGGTGVNITPPPREIIKPRTLEKSKGLIRELAQKIGITGYSRIDAFLNTTFGDLIIIEINTLPALTPSTVLFHQALAEENPLYPREFLEKIIFDSGY